MKIIKKINKDFIIIGFLFLMGLAVRLDFTFQLTGLSLLTGDAVSYNSIAENLIHGKGFINTAGEVTVLPPVYPAFLAFFYLLFGQNFFIIQLVQIILNLLAIYLFYLILKQYLNKTFLYIFLILSVLYPFFIYWGRYLLTDINFVFLNTLLVYIILQKNKNQKFQFIIIGLILSLLILLRAAALLLPVFLFFYYIIQYDLKTALHFFVFAGLIICVFLITWGSYNYSKHGTFQLVASYGGLALYMANNPKTCPEKVYYSTMSCHEKEFIKSILQKSFIDRDKLCKERAIEYIKKFPLTFVKNNLIRIKIFWKEQRRGKILHWPGLKILNNFIKYIDSIVLYLGLIGLLVCLKEFKKYSLFYILILYYTAIYSLYFVVELARYRIPVMLLVIFFAVKGIEFLYSLLSKIHIKK